MNQVTKRNSLRRGSLALLLVSLLVPVTAARANNWTFNLVGVPSALNPESPGGEFIQMTGGGTFDPDMNMVRASGAAVIFHAGDHPAPPLGKTLRGTWTATGFESFTPDFNGMGPALTFDVTVSLALGQVVLTGTMTVMEDGISLVFPGVEEYEEIPGSGSVHFVVHGKAEP